jgi:deazaflavin-dependent oxidoreductase (nitroreductase family)
MVIEQGDRSGATKGPVVVSQPAVATESRANAAPARGIPTIVRLLSPVVQRLLGIGMPMGQNALLTVRGRKSGQPRTFTITLLEAAGRRYVFAAFGDVNWVHNLRAAGVATVRQGRRHDAVVAVELTPDEAAPIMRAAFGPALRVPVFGSMIGSWYGLTKDSTSADYLASARSHTGFDLGPAH